jgi:signal transduction histidine kinase
MQTQFSRILIADDTPALHEAYRNIFAIETDELKGLPGMAKFASVKVETITPNVPHYAITHVSQGEEALAAAATAQLAGAPFALAILDVRMPPGMDGVQTARRLRVQHPDLQIVLCTAFADYSWSDLLQVFPESDGVLLLKKPFDAIEIHQVAAALCRKWQLAAENQELVRNLENRVAVRTAQLTQTAAELASALTAAQAANRAKHDFLRCVSHELNSPLNGIHGAASLLCLKDEPPTQKMGQIITESSTRLNRLFTQILLYLQLESAPAGSPQPLQMSGLLTRAVEPHRTAAQAKGLTLQISFTAPPLLTILGQPKLVENALYNLVENAIKFTSIGSVCVSLRYDYTQESLLLEVTDTGDGIGQAQREELFSLFSPGDSSLTRKQSGVGLGLALVSRIARVLNGEISMRSGVPAGSVFTLRVPCTLPEGAKSSE